MHDPRRRVAAWRRHVVAAVLLMCVASPAVTGELRGDVSLGRSGDAQRAADVVVWLDRIPERVERKLTDQRRHWLRRARPRPALAKIVMKRRQYQPSVTAIAVGGALELRNEDKVWHGPFSVSPTRAFNLGKRPPGRADTLRFDSTGVITLRCDIHPEMSAFIVVTPNHAFTRPDGNGHWQLPELPAGNYEVHAWHPRLGELRRPVTVPARGTVSLPIHW